MCGICGVIGFEDKKLLKKMCNVIAHRGPDDRGTFFDRNVMIGHQRLSIIDLETGRQPIHNEDESIWISFNGEIYNYKELRKKLENNGHRFYTSSDTEVIVHLYEEYGNFCTKELRGIFAFAIWDSDKKKILLARDRLGVKPLYYTLIGENLLFSSEIKALLQYEGLKREVDYSALNDLLTFRYIPGPRTIFKGINKLLPAHILTYDGSSITTHKYWNLSLSSTKNSEEFYSKKIIELLEESIRIRLMSEVPLGVYLSGGLDSSAIVGIMSKLTDEIITFSVGFGDEKLNELKYAKMVAEYFDTEHYEVMVDCRPNVIPKVIWHLDEPLADSAAIPTYLMSELAKKHITVVLTGEGSDELFAGYSHYKFFYLTDKYKNLLRLVKIPSFLSSIKFKRLRNYIKFLYTEREMSYLELISVFNEEEKAELYNDLEITQNHNVVDTIKPYFRDDKNKRFLDQILLMDIRRWLPDDLLLKVDKMTMANAIEARVPFLDHKLVELSATIPLNLKLNGLNDKYVYRKAISKVVPKDILKRKKHGFIVPINSWLDGELGEVASQVFSEENVLKRGYFKYKTIQKILRNHNKSQPYYKRQFWTLFVFELWHRIYIDNDNIYNPKLKLDNYIRV